MPGESFEASAETVVPLVAKAPVKLRGVSPRVGVMESHGSPVLTDHATDTRLVTPIKRVFVGGSVPGLVKKLSWLGMVVRSTGAGGNLGDSAHEEENARDAQRRRTATIF